MDRRESEESWASLLRDLKRRGMAAPALAVGDGALGFWAALREVWPESREQRCWVHKILNVLDKLPKRLQARAEAMLHEIMQAPDRASAQEETQRFVGEFSPRYPKAVECLVSDQETLLTFFDFPAEHARAGESRRRAWRSSAPISRRWEALKTEMSHVGRGFMNRLGLARVARRVPLRGAVIPGAAGVDVRDNRDTFTQSNRETLGR